MARLDQGSEAPGVLLAVFGIGRSRRSYPTGGDLGGIPVWNGPTENPATP
jgi:hypothetical protein